jgi:hypothetical protein
VLIAMNHMPLDDGPDACRRARDTRDARVVVGLRP